MICRVFRGHSFSRCLARRISSSSWAGSAPSKEHLCRPSLGFTQHLSSHPLFEQYLYARTMPVSRGKQTRAAHERRANAGTENAAHGDDLYFQSYAHLGIHEEMIRDKVRTDAYRDAINSVADSIRGKVVIDVGCGTGILSIFAARAGARKVYAIDASDIATQAKQVVEANGLSDVITVLHGKVEEVVIEEKADVLVSEWMGYMLFYESMLDSVICARDKWLKPTGLMLPSHASLYVAPISHPERYDETLDFWKDVYGIDMSAMIPAAKKCFFGEPCVESVATENILSWPALIKTIDCKTVTVEDISEITTSFSVSSMMMAPLHGFALWFDVSFEGPSPGGPAAAAPAVSAVSSADATPGSSASPAQEPASGSGGATGGSASTPQGPKLNGKPAGSGGKGKGDKKCVVLTTAPEEEPTHWVQTVLYIDEPVGLDQDQVVEGTIRVTRNTELNRFLDIRLDYTTGGKTWSKSFVMK